MGFKDYYEILGLQSNKVTDTQIKNAYREYVKKYHPDVNSGNKISEERFKDIGEAYKVLSNPVSKRKYDRTWIRNRAKIGSSYEKDNEYPDTFLTGLSKILFGRDLLKIKPKDNIPAKGDNINTEIDINVLEAYKGVTKKISLKDINNQSKTYSVNIPSGIQNGEKIKLSHLGKKGKNGGKNGDLIIKININNTSKYILEGNILKSYLDITPWEAGLSSNVLYEGIDGSFNIYVPEGTQSGEHFSIPNKGYLKKDGTRGDLLLETRIKVPKKLTENEKKLFTQLKQESNFNPRNKSTFEAT